jgi:hypothetical protein
MAACASGGLLGVGAGNGWLKNIFAANTDMVFGVVTEELGLIVSVLCIAAILILVFFAIRSSTTARSSFYVIGACAALAIMMFQIILNVLGCLDILPFTGVTFPFVSKGGSSLIVCWGLLAFVKSCDTRQNASFIVKAPEKVRAGEKDPIEDYDSGSMYDDQPYEEMPNSDRQNGGRRDDNYDDYNGYYDFDNDAYDSTDSGIDPKSRDIYDTHIYRYDDREYNDDDATKLFDLHDNNFDDEFIGEHDVLDDWKFEFPEDDSSHGHREDDR